MTRKPGITYVMPDGLLLVVIEATEEGVVGLVLEDNPRYARPLKPGTLMTVLKETTYWKEGVPFASPREQGKVSS